MTTNRAFSNGKTWPSFFSRGESNLSRLAIFPCSVFKLAHSLPRMQALPGVRHSAFYDHARTALPQRDPLPRPLCDPQGPLPLRLAETCQVRGRVPVPMG